MMRVQQKETLQPDVTRLKKIEDKKAKKTTNKVSNKMKRKLRNIILGKRGTKCKACTRKPSSNLTNRDGPDCHSVA